ADADQQFSWSPSAGPYESCGHAESGSQTVDDDYKKWACTSAATATTAESHSLRVHACAEFVPFLRFDNEIRTIICTTNAIESINARLRRALKARGHFPTEQAALKCLYLVLMSLDPSGKGRQRWSNRWKAALNALVITLDGRLSAGRE